MVKCEKASGDTEQLTTIVLFNLLLAIEICLLAASCCHVLPACLLSSCMAKADVMLLCPRHWEIQAGASCSTC